MEREERKKERERKEEREKEREREFTPTAGNMSQGKLVPYPLLK